MRLTVVCPGGTASERYALTLEHALRGHPARVVTSISCSPSRWTKAA